MQQNKLTFTEEEYKLWFCSGKQNQKLMRVLLAYRGVDTKFVKREALEELVFEGIPRETRDNIKPFSGLRFFIPESKLVTSLFSVYKYFVNNRRLINWDEVCNYVLTRRRVLNIVSLRTIAGIILSESTIYDNNYSKNFILKGQCINKALTTAKRGTHSSCVTPHVLKEVTACLCEYCIFKLTDLADDCTIKLGRKIFDEMSYKFLLFRTQQKFDVVPDIVKSLGLIFTLI